MILEERKLDPKIDKTNSFECLVKELYHIDYTRVSVQSPELGPPQPLSCKRMCLVYCTWVLGVGGGGGGGTLSYKNTGFLYIFL